MKFNPITALAALALASAAPAGAALVSYNEGDLLMGFHASGGAGVGQTYVVDLGSVASFRDASGTVTLNLGDLGADLSSIYGANWSTRTDLSWGIAGTSSNVGALNGDPRAALYASRAGDNASPWSITASSARISASTLMEGAGTTFANGSATANSASATIQSDSLPNGWRSYMAAGGSPSNTLGGNDFGAFTDIEANPSQSLSLFRLTSSADGTDVGTFNISNTGTVTFATVPEVSSLFIVGLGGLLAAARRRRTV